MGVQIPHCLALWGSAKQAVCHEKDHVEHDAVSYGATCGTGDTRGYARGTRQSHVGSCTSPVPVCRHGEWPVTPHSTPRNGEGNTLSLTLGLSMARDTPRSSRGQSEVPGAGPRRQPSTFPRLRGLVRGMRSSRRRALEKAMGRGQREPTEAWWGAARVRQNHSLPEPISSLAQRPVSGTISCGL